MHTTLPQVTAKNLVILFLITFGLRAATFHLFIKPDMRYQQADSMDYHNCALGICHGSGMHRLDTKVPIFWRTPGYPAYLAFFYWLSGSKKTRLENVQREHAEALWVQLFLCSFVPLIILLLALTLTNSLAIAWIVAYTSALHGGLILASTFLLTEGLALIFFYLFLILLYKNFKTYGEQSADPRTRIRDLIIAALALGAATWIRPMGEFVALITVVLIAALSNATWRHKIIYTLVFCSTFFVSISPWYVRNYQLTGQVFFCPMLGAYLNSFTGPKIIRRARGFSLEDSIRLSYKTMEAKLAQTEKETSPGVQIAREKICGTVAYPLIWRYPWYALQEWLPEVAKTTFDLYGYQYVALAKNIFRYDPLEEHLSEKLYDCLLSKKTPPSIRALCWLELLYAAILWLGITGGLFFFWLAPLVTHTASAHQQKLALLWLKVVPMIGALVILTGGFGYARLRLPAEPLLIILSLTFWHWVFKKLYCTH